MQTSDYVAVKTGRSGASFLARKAPEATRWGDFYVMSMAVWQDFLLTYGCTALTTSERTSWVDIAFIGETSSGVWLKGAAASDVQAVTSTSVKYREYVHVSDNAYADLRRRYPRWWKTALEQKGWSKVPPDAMTWARCGEPTPDETKQYMDFIKKRAWESKIPSEVKKFTMLYEMCDPSGKILDLAKAKSKT